MNAKTYSKTYPISAGQRTTIKMAQGQLGIADAVYRAMLKERYGVTSCTKLSFNQAGHFIKELEGKGFVLRPNAKPAKKQRHTAHIAHTRLPAERTTLRAAPHTILISLATPEEIDKLNKVAALISWRVEGGLALFLEKRMGIKGGRVKTSHEAGLATEGLKKMFENAQKKAHGAAWWTMTFDNPAIMAYIAIHKPLEWR